MNELVHVDLSTYGLPEDKALAVKKDFDAVLGIAVELEDEYNKIVSQKQITEDVCKEAKALRLKYVKVRTGIAVVHKERKAFYLSGGLAVDGLKNAYTHAITGNEEKLKEIETHFERIEAEKRQRLHDERAAALRKFEVEPSGDLGGMEPDVWQNYIAGVEVNYNAQKEAEAKAEADRIAKEKAEAEERERIRKENERLKAEAAEREKAEKARVEKERKEREAREKAEQERLAKIESERKAEREEAERKLAAERAEREKIEREAREKAEAEAKAKAEADKKARNVAHRRAVNQKALQTLLTAVPELTEDQGKAVITAIAKGAVEHVTIGY